MSAQVAVPVEVRPQTATSTILLITPTAQNYDWGRTGQESEVAMLQEAAGRPIDAAKPYAELWMGTHPSGPSTLTEGDLVGEQLLAFIRDHPEVLGDAMSIFGADLPFLFKVLSVRTALSIQSHPDKKLAERLHAERPHVYKDSNHKPEMAIALSGFEALCGFCPHEEIVRALQHVPELRDCCGASVSDAYIASSSEGRKEALKAAFTALMTADTAGVEECLARMISRLASSTEQLSSKEQLVQRLNAQYPGDVGVFAAWFLNYVTLESGEAIALAANEPHAYLSGEIIECMATSDNVIRAGLTPKLRDTDVLCDSLTYSQGLPEVLKGETTPEKYLALYRPPREFKEFEVWRFAPPKGAEVELPAAKGPMLVLVQRGAGVLQGKEVFRGHVVFVPAGVALKCAANEDMVAWIAAPNEMGL